MNIKYATSVFSATLALLASALPSAASGDTVANARSATAIYNDPAAALAGGYELLTDASDTACIDQPGAGTMGVHYVKGALIQSGTLDPARPQALVYEPEPNGQLRLGALEYVVFQSTWDAAHSAPPALFGQKFMLTPADNRFGLPAFYSLHAWIWKHNPKGTFEPWNPQVHCGSQAAGFEPNDVASAADDVASAAPSMAGMAASFTCAVPAETATDMMLDEPARAS
jgi:hypothetical protein